MSLGKHTLANVMGAVIPLLVALITVPMYLALVGTERFGVLAVLWALLSYFVFFDLGLGRAIAQRLSSTDKVITAADASQLVWTASIATLVASLLGGAALWWAAGWYTGTRISMGVSLAEEARVAVRWLPAVLAIALVSSILQGALQARLKFYELNVIQASAGAASQLLPLGIALSGHVQLQYLIPAVFLPRAVAGVGMALLVRRHVPLGRIGFDCSQLRQLLGYGGWISLGSLFAPLLVILDRLLIASVQGPRFVTFYTVPYDLVTKLFIFSGSLSSAIFPRLAAANDPVALADSSTKLLIEALTPVVIFGVLFVQQFLTVWVGPEMAQHGGPVAEILLVGIWINTLVIPHNARILATRNPRDITLIYLIQLPAYVAGLWYATKTFGLVGAASVWTLRVLADTAMILLLARSLSRVVSMCAAPAAAVFLSILVTRNLVPYSISWLVAVLGLLAASAFISRSVLAFAYRSAVTRTIDGKID